MALQSFRLLWWLCHHACGCRRCKFDPWIRKIPWRRKWQPTAVLLPGESHGQRSLGGYSPWGHKESDITQWLDNSGHKSPSLPLCPASVLSACLPFLKHLPTLGLPHPQMPWLPLGENRSDPPITYHRACLRGHESLLDTQEELPRRKYLQSQFKKKQQQLSSLGLCARLLMTRISSLIDNSPHPLKQWFSQLSQFLNWIKHGHVL